VNSQEYLEIWSAASAEILQQTLGPKFAVDWERLDDPGPAKPDANLGVWLEFTVGAPLDFTQAFWISPSDAVYLGQSFIGETPDPLAELTDDDRDAVAELFRQIAGNVSLALKAKVGKECPVVFAGSRLPDWTPKLRARYRWTAEGCPPLSVHLQADSALEAPQAPAASVPVAAPVSRPLAPLPPPPPAPMVPPPPPPETRNLELLLDMQLDVTIRFGKREMILRDILELNPGSVVDFEQRIEDPVELLLGPRVIGRGEVVVVDGNYGLRVTEITGAHARLNSLVK
jgi:flagellar motor switch protein FliN/FliY